MKTVFIKSLCLILLMLAAGTTDAQNFEVNGIYYNVLSEEEGTVEVTMGNYSGDVVIPGEVTYDGSTYSVTTIGEYAFGWCEALTSVEMPSVTTIGEYAFGWCEALTSVEMPSVTTIGDYAFYYCNALTSVSMPSVVTIGEDAFYTCSSLTSVSMPSATTIGDYAFEYCSTLTSVEMPAVATIGEDAFYGCSALTSIYLPASCASIDGNPFIECGALKGIVVDEDNPNFSSYDGVLYDKNVETLLACPGSKSFIDIPSSVTTIGEDAFGACSALTSVEMPAVTAIGDYAFYECSSLTSISMPSVTTIGNSAFERCSALTSVEMPSVTTIGDYAFNSCSALTSVSMPSVTTIGDGAFYYCSALTSIDIPASVSMIDDYAFTACSSLTSVYCHWEDPLECDPWFEETVLANATLYVPDGCVDAYRAVKPWSDFANIEEGGYSGIADTPGSGLSVKVIDGAISIEGGDGTASAPVVEVYSAGGVCVYRGTDTVIGGLGHGVYVVKVGGTVQKVAL